MTRKFLVGAGSLLVALAASWVVVAGPAHAVVSGPCTGQAELDGETTDAVVTAEEAGRVTIPREANVAYRGEIGIPARENMPHSGEITLRMAPGLDTIPLVGTPTLASWNWGGTTDETATEGTTSYNLPGGLLGGVALRVEGSHTQDGVACSGHVDLRLEGSVINVGSLVAAGATAVSGVGVGLAARGKRP